MLPPQLQAAGSAIRAALTSKPLDPPSRKELAGGSATQQALRFLVQTGEVVEVNADIVLLTETFNRAAETLCKHLQQKGPATVSELRQVLGASRRIVIPLLEKLDRDGTTRRTGDLRALAPKSQGR
jgi:selenocysteine-specific elongation factor